MDYSLFLGALSGMTHLVAFAIYNKQMLKGTSRPNTATWTLWVFLTILNASSYTVMTGDFVKGILPTAGALACIFTFLFSLFKGKLSRLDFYDKLALIIGMISGFIWWYYKSATYANLILQISFIISFVPTYRGVWDDPKKEHALPWYVWSVAYFIMTLNVFLFSWRGQYQDLVYPILALLTHAPVGLLTYRKKTALSKITS
jgi:hypothetical protein